MWKPTVNYHLKQVFADGELQAGAAIRKFRITAADGKSYDTQHYHLAAIIAVGYKVNSERAVQFRKWATSIIESYTIKGFAMDDERRLGRLRYHRGYDQALLRHGAEQAPLGHPRPDGSRGHHLACRCRERPDGSHHVERRAQGQNPEVRCRCGEELPHRLNRFIAATDRKVLADAGRVTAEIAQAHAESEFEKYRIVQDRLFESDFDRMIHAQQEDTDTT